MRKKDDEKQKNIKKAVIRLILEEGFHGTSISKIAKAAGVSPATVYIYYENKDMMLQDIYREYSEDIFYNLMNKVTNDMNGSQLIESMIRSYYLYISENDEIYHFVEQFSNCPALSNHCEVMKGIFVLYNIFEDMKAQRIIKSLNNETLLALMFSPVKSIYSNQCYSEKKRESMLQEIIKVIQDALLL